MGCVTFRWGEVLRLSRARSRRKKDLSLGPPDADFTTAGFAVTWVADVMVPDF